MSKANGQPRWPPLIAEDGWLESPLFKGRVIVEDVKQDRFTTTVKLTEIIDDMRETP